MKKKKTSSQNTNAMETPDREVEEEEHLLTTPIPANTDICQTIMSRYSKSKAPQHHHLCASASAMKSILQEEHLPLTPIPYFAATISSISDNINDDDTLAPLSSFLSILIPLIDSECLSKEKAADAVDVLVKVLGKKRGEGVVVSTATVRCVVKCLGSLVLLCDLEDWSRVRDAFETVLGFSVDKRPKVRRCALVCVENVFKLLPYSVIKEASKAVLSFFKSYMPCAIEINDAKFHDGSKHDMLSKSEHLEVVHMLNSLKLVVPYLSKKVSKKILSDLCNLSTCQFSPLTRHLYNVLEAFFETSGVDAVVPEAENLILSLTSYVSSGNKNPMDTVMSASCLLKKVMGKLHGIDPNICTRKIPFVFLPIAGLLVSDTYGSQAANVLVEMINSHMDGNCVKDSQSEVHDDKVMSKEKLKAIRSTCAVFEDLLTTPGGISNEHVLAVISNLFTKLGEDSYIFMKGIILKLADFITLEAKDVTETNHLHECIGSAVRSIGPEKILTLIPISLDTEKNICSNIWLLPILKKYIIGASLEYYLVHVLPLAKSLQQACQKVKKSAVRRDLRACIYGLWDLLPAFCRYPTNVHLYFEPLTEVLLEFLKEESYMHKNVSLALQELVHQNRNILLSTEASSESAETSGTYSVKVIDSDSRSVPSHYSREVATRNMQVLASSAMDLLQALTDVFFSSPPESRAYLKEAIGCIASIVENSQVHKLFLSSLEKFKVDGKFDKSAGDDCMSDDEELSGSANKQEQEAKRCMMMEFACSLLTEAKKDLLNSIFNYIKPTLQASDGVGLSEAYCALSRMFEEHMCFFSSQLDEMVKLMVGVKSHVDIVTLRSRLSCFQSLLVCLLKSDLEERNTIAFLILNEIIVALKDGNEEPRKAAYDVLLRISDSLNDSSSANSGSPLQQLFNMIMGYLSGAPPPIMSAAVAALSLLIFKNSDFCFSVPELIPSVIALLRSKAKEVIKAVLGFVKVLVSCIQASDLHKLLPDIVNGILPWSSVSKNHFRSKVATIFEIMIRKCGYASVEIHVPDRYRGFIKNVKEQRHHKTNTNDTETSDRTPKQAVSSPKRERKRKSREAPRDEEADSRASSVNQMERIKRKGKFSMPNANNSRMSTGSGGQWAKKDEKSYSGGNRNRTKGAPWNRSGGDNRRQGKRSRTTNAPSHKAGSNPKFHKRRKADQ